MTKQQAISLMVKTWKDNSDKANKGTSGIRKTMELVYNELSRNNILNLKQAEKKTDRQRKAKKLFDQYCKEKKYKVLQGHCNRLQF